MFNDCVYLRQECVTNHASVLKERNLYKKDNLQLCHHRSLQHCHDKNNKKKIPLGYNKLLSDAPTCKHWEITTYNTSMDTLPMNIEIN